MTIQKRNALVEQNLGLVNSFVKQFKRRLQLNQCNIDNGDMIEDLIQEGRLGLMKAAEKFDPTRGIKFSTYAIWWIRCYVQRAFNGDRNVYVPEWLLNKRALIYRAMSVQKLLSGELANIDDVISEYVSDCNADTVRRFIETNFYERHIDEEINREGGITLHDILPDNGASNPERITLARNQTRYVITILSALLPPRHFHVLLERKGLVDGIPKTLEEIGSKLGITRERVRQIEKASQKILENEFCDETEHQKAV